MTKTEMLREKIAAVSRDDAYDALGLSKYNKGWRNKEHHMAGLASADKILQACTEAGLVFKVKDAGPHGGVYYGDYEKTEEIEWQG